MIREDFGKTAWKRRLIRVFAGRTSLTIDFVVRLQHIYFDKNIVY